MQKKIVFLIISSMLLANTVFAFGINTENKINTQSNKTSVDVPTWEVGDHWEYTIDINGDYVNPENTEIEFDITISNLNFEVIDDGEPEYKLSVTGSISGTGSFMGLLSGRINADIDGYLFVNKSNLAINRIEDLKILGSVSIANLDVDIYSLEFIPTHNPYDFPIEEGESWTVPTEIMQIQGYINKPSLPGISPEIYMEYWIYEHINTYVSDEQVQEYNCLKISNNYMNYWYAPDAKNIVKAENTDYINLYMYGSNDYYYRILNFDLTLTDTNYEPPNDPPETPVIPVGETDCYQYVEYTYETSTNDPNGHDVKYGFDWNGDDTVDYWTNFYDSGETLSVDYMFEDSGTYELKVKAKDTKDEESSFSEPLIVTVNSNSRPLKPEKPTGTAEGRRGETYTYTTKTTEPDDEELYYLFSWGDGTSNGWLGPYDSDVEVSSDKSWSSQGDYEIKVKAKDAHGAESEWSDPLTVSMPKNKPKLFNLNLNDFPIIQKLLSILFSKGS